MKVDKRLSEEFGMQLPTPTSWWDWVPSGSIVDGLLVTAVIFALMGAGGYLSYLLPGIPFYFVTLAISFLALVAIFVFIILPILLIGIEDHGD